eukprot:SAG31_NODE_921_length_10984_cov_2.779329_11_plen_60_part_01
MRAGLRAAAPAAGGVVGAIVPVRVDPAGQVPLAEGAGDVRPRERAVLQGAAAAAQLQWAA